MKTPTEPANKTVDAYSKAISVEDAISMFEDMVPSKEVMMRREMEQMFPSIRAALKRDVSEEQVIAGLRKKWPDAHVATLVKLLNAERERCLMQDGAIDCKPFGSPRKSKIRTATSIGETRDSAPTPPASSDAANGDEHEVSA